MRQQAADSRAVAAPGTPPPKMSPAEAGLKNVEGKTLAQEGAGTYNLSPWRRRDNGSALPSDEARERGFYRLLCIQAEAGAFVAE
jgi:hypothetical protein